MRRARAFLVWGTILCATWLGSENGFATEWAQRTWRSSTGKYEVAARLLELRKQKVLLRKADGKNIWVAMDDLSEVDQRYVRTQSRSLAREADRSLAGGEVPSDSSAERGVAPSRTRPAGTQTTAKKRPDGKVLYGIKWYDMDDVGDLAKTDDKPIMWFRVLGDLDGFM